VALDLAAEAKAEVSQASMASTIGLRGKAIVTEVCNSTRSVVVAASAIVSIESCASSPHVTTSNPPSSARRAASGARFGHPPTPVTSFMAQPPPTVTA
jgi:hypothetical protein